jgi:hypothetical protein
MKISPILLAGAKRAALYVGRSQEGRDGTAQNRMVQNTKMNITCSFLELQSPDFAWKYVWTVRTNSKTKWPPNTKLSITHSFF